MLLQRKCPCFLMHSIKANFLLPEKCQASPNLHRQQGSDNVKLRRQQEPQTHCISMLTHVQPKPPAESGK